MRLSELEPRWLNDNVFAFRCPHCTASGWLLSCKRVPMSMGEQFDLFEQTLGLNWNGRIVPSRAEFAWTFLNQGFEHMTVAPSLDASASGHWHGHIQDGAIVGGVQA